MYNQINAAKYFLLYAATFFLITPTFLQMVII
jgi:hypothetical protein